MLETWGEEEDLSLSLSWALLRVSDGYVRREHLRLFRSFFLLLSPALEGDSSFSLAWLDSLEELCWLKWLGTWRASPPWEAKLALQPPTTHCGATTTKKNNKNTFSYTYYRGRVDAKSYYRTLRCSETFARGHYTEKSVKSTAKTH